MARSWWVLWYMKTFWIISLGFTNKRLGKLLVDTQWSLLVMGMMKYRDSFGFYKTNGQLNGVNKVLLESKLVRLELTLSHLVAYQISWQPLIEWKSEFVGNEESRKNCSADTKNR